MLLVFNEHIIKFIMEDNWNVGTQSGYQKLLSE